MHVSFAISRQLVLLLLFFSSDCGQKLVLLQRTSRTTKLFCRQEPVREIGKCEADSVAFYTVQLHTDSSPADKSKLRSVLWEFLNSEAQVYFWHFLTSLTTKIRSLKNMLQVWPVRWDDRSIWNWAHIQIKQKHVQVHRGEFTGRSLSLKVSLNFSMFPGTQLAFSECLLQAKNEGRVRSRVSSHKHRWFVVNSRISLIR